jgi:hypothetical protein
MTIATFKKSAILRRGFRKEDIIFPIGHILEYINNNHSYHAYYEIHSYSALFKSNGSDLTIKMTRVEGTKTFRLDNFRLSHTNGDYLNRYKWEELFEEECPIKNE